MSADPLYGSNLNKISNIAKIFAIPESSNVEHIKHDEYNTAAV
jgi:hypothetical protein